MRVLSLTSDSDAFGSPAKSCNLRVADLTAMVEQPRAAGVAVAPPPGVPEPLVRGLRHPEGNRVQLWEPDEASPARDPARRMSSIGNKEPMRRIFAGLSEGDSPAQQADVVGRDPGLGKPALREPASAASALGAVGLGAALSPRQRASRRPRRGGGLPRRARAPGTTNCQPVHASTATWTSWPARHPTPPTTAPGWPRSCRS